MKESDKVVSARVASQAQIGTVPSGANLGPESLGSLVSLPNVISPQVENDLTKLSVASGCPLPAVEYAGSAGAVYATDCQWGAFHGPAFRIDANRTYKVSGYFRTVSPESEGLSRLYLGFMSFDQSGAVINDAEGYRGPQAVGVSEISTIAGSQVVTVSTDLDAASWTGNGVLHGYQRQLGFYFDGNIEKRPDFLLRGVTAGWDVPGVDSTGAFLRIDSAQPRRLVLNQAIPAAMVARITPQTRIMRHTHAGSWQYAAAAHDPVSRDQFQYFEGTISGEGWDDLNNGASRTRWRFGARFARMIVLTNYNYDVGAGSTVRRKLQFYGIRVEEQ